MSGLDSVMRSRSCHAVLRRWGRFVRGDASRQGEPEDGAAALPRLHPDAASVRGDDTATDGETQAHAAALGLVHAIELVEDPLGVLPGDPLPPVGDGDL